MSRITFDQLDLNILRLLSANARKPYLEIARECNVSGASIHQRIQRMNAAGVIKGAESLISPATIGYTTCAYVGMFLSEPSQFEHVIEELSKIPEIVECHFTSGQYDILFKVYARDNDHLLQIIQAQIQSLGLARTETLISFKQVFCRQIPIDDAILDL